MTFAGSIFLETTPERVSKKEGFFVSSVQQWDPKNKPSKIEIDNTLYYLYITSDRNHRSTS